MSFEGANKSPTTAKFDNDIEMLKGAQGRLIEQIHQLGSELQVLGAPQKQCEGLVHLCRQLGRFDVHLQTAIAKSDDHKKQKMMNRQAPSPVPKVKKGNQSFLRSPSLQHMPPISENRSTATATTTSSTTASSASLPGFSNYPSGPYTGQFIYGVHRDDVSTMSYAHTDSLEHASLEEILCSVGVTREVEITFKTTEELFKILNTLNDLDYPKNKLYVPFTSLELNEIYVDGTFTSYELSERVTHHLFKH